MVEQGWIVGIYTATPVLGLARVPVILGPEASSVQQFWQLDRQLAAEMHICLDSFISSVEWSALAGIAVAVGPGSFTGCRLGVTVARCLGRNLKIPVYGISTLDAWASSVFQTRSGNPELLQPELLQPELLQPELLQNEGSDLEKGFDEVAVRLDAKRGQWYGSVYQRDPSQIIGGLIACVEEQLWTLQEWEDMLRQRKRAALVHEIIEPVQNPPVLALTQLAQQAYQQGSRPPWQDVLPHYGRQPPIDPAVFKAVVPSVTPEAFLPKR
ncbi:MAG: tRNA (adenosine(37)-N6)-threonylcarbamoyltransferase complex dimerization subunit type 1 TsaB [Synechococcaceae cyanobacterium SM2_3_2]|nr:tRNA (adenosine(37)-N6)-threonylcarbamoyltransferase complex dimerization subunit type 1 TsaB [Synechococcaceae cyanobacterium SM2_3_2]